MLKLVQNGIAKKDRDDLFRARFDPKAVKTVVTDGSPIDKANLTRGYLADEIRAVIKGRGISDLDTYLDIRRTGRRTKFGDPLRTQTWELKEAWDAAMAGVPIDEAARKRPALQQALGFW